MNKIAKKKLEQLMAKKKVFIADMRSPVNFRDGHVPGATNLPLRNFVNTVMGMPKDSVIVAYSTKFDDVDLVQGMNYAEQMGFTNLYAAEYDSIK